MKKTLITSLLFAGLIANPALAHHPLGGEVPQTLLHGLLSGIGHPIIGFDHLAFILGIGFLAALSKQKILPVGYVAGTLAGALLIVGGVILPFAEVMISFSVLLIGTLAMFRRNMPLLAAVLISAIAGVFHGWAYGEAIIGAEPTPIIAYLFGFGMTQMVIASGVMLAAGWMLRGDFKMVPRFAGAIVAGVGLTYLVEIAESAILPAL